MSKAVRSVLPADVFAPMAVRRQFRRWLTALDWPRAAAEDLLLAVSEAVSNAADHAYPPDRPGKVEVEASCLPGVDGNRRVVVTVRDHGAWRPPPAWHENRRRGLPLMRACTESLDVTGGPDGTEVRMVSKPVPAPLAR